MSKLTLSALALFTTLGLAACSSDNDEGADFERAGENAGEMIDDGVDATQETWDDATGQDQSTWDDMRDGADDAVDEMGDAADDAGDSIEESYDEMTQ